MRVVVFCAKVAPPRWCWEWLGAGELRVGWGVLVCVELIQVLVVVRGCVGSFVLL